ncbi:Protein SAWADEE HOMEODOMAIN HOMOLOG 1 [Linum grandiflorum]
MMEMKKLYGEKGEETLLPDFCKGIASTFSFFDSVSRNRAITWQQVQSWFVECHGKAQPESTESPMPLDMLVEPPDVETTVPKPKVWKVGAKAADLSELIYEAKSTRDNAWYDVGTFLNYRVAYTGNLEVKVRFAGFDYSHDEWVNLKAGVRDRSIPLEASECHKVSVGDLVLCYRERFEQSLYYDAHVLEIRRQKHEPDCCDCIFVVRYDHDDAQEKVGLDWICCRPGSRASSSRQQVRLPPKSIFY